VLDVETAAVDEFDGEAKEGLLMHGFADLFNGCHGLLFPGLGTMSSEVRPTSIHWLSPQGIDQKVISRGRRANGIV
jgi:hypothetical protein